MGEPGMMLGRMDKARGERGHRGDRPGGERPEGQERGKGRGRANLISSSPPATTDEACWSGVAPG